MRLQNALSGQWTMAGLHHKLRGCSFEPDRIFFALSSFIVVGLSVAQNHSLRFCANLDQCQYLAATRPFGH
jgi:hypothetical protein